MSISTDLSPDLAWLSIREACEFYRVSRRTVYNWIQARKVEARTTPGGSRRIAVDRRIWDGKESA